MARHAHHVSKVAAAGVTQLLQFLFNTRQRTLVLGGTNAYIKAFCDSDWAGDCSSRKSTGAVSWAWTSRMGEQTTETCRSVDC